MGTNLVLQHPKYNKTQLIQISSKGDKFYVVGTRPVELYEGKTKQDRLSTGTSDEREAHRMWDKLEAQIYSKWDKLLNRDPFIELLKQHWPYDLVEIEGNGDPARFISKYDGGKVLACETVWFETNGNMTVVNELFKYLDYYEALELRDRITPREDPYPLAIKQQKMNELREFITELDGEAPPSQPNRNKEKPVPALNKTGCPTILEVLPLYLQDIKWVKVTQKEKQSQKSRIVNIAALLGDLPIDQVRAPHATTIARTLADEGYAHGTIRTWNQALSGLLTWAVTTDTPLAQNRSINPVENWIIINHIKNVSVAAYGKEKRSFDPFTEEQLYKLFALPMPEKDRLLLSILATTGMRLDEAALLTWSQVKETNGMRYFDLTEAKVKNSNSRREVALPDILKLPKPDTYPTTKLFDFRLDADGKSSKHASQYLNANYAHKVRYDEADDRKVIHSFRHSMIMFMVNLDPTPSSEIMDWIVGHDEDGGKKSERRKSYKHDVALKLKYDVVNRIHHPWLTQQA